MLDSSTSTLLLFILCLMQKQANVGPGHNQTFRASRQVAGWKPSQERMNQLKQCLTADSRRWISLAAWLHIDVTDLESFPCPFSAMISTLCSKYATAGSTNYIRRAIEDLEEPLQRLGSDLQQASDIVKDMLSSGACLRPDGTDVVVRQPVQDTWPSPNLHHSIEVNEYRFSPYGYRTLRSEQYADSRYGTSEAVQIANPSLMSQRDQLEEFDQGARPRTLLSDINNPHANRSVPIPTQEAWPAEGDRNHADHNDNNLVEDQNSLVPRGVPNRRKSSGYCTVGDDGIDPNRPRVSIPNVPEYPYDQPVHSPEAGAIAAGVTNSVLADHIGDEGYDIVQIPTDVSKPQQGTSDQSEPNDSVDMRAIARGGQPEPPYVNVVQGHTKPISKGYVTSMKGSKLKH